MTEAYKEKNKAAAKIAKLERKVQKLEQAAQKSMAAAGEKETAANTAANVRLVKPTERDMGMAPPPVPSERLPAASHLPPSTQAFSHAAPTAAFTAPTASPAQTPTTARPPLRSVSVFDKTQMPTSFSKPVSLAGLKRSRDADADAASEKLPADAIMQPLPAKSLTATQKNAFAPVPVLTSLRAAAATKENSRPLSSTLGGGGAFNAGGLKGPNAFAESTPRRNVFAVDP